MLIDASRRFIRKPVGEERVLVPADVVLDAIEYATTVLKNSRLASDFASTFVEGLLDPVEDPMPVKADLVMWLRRMDLSL